MNNEVLEKVLQFLKQLRCEQITRESSVQIPGLQEAEKLFEKCSLYIDRLPTQEKQIIGKWFAKKRRICQFTGTKRILSGICRLCASFVRLGTITGGVFIR